jgi:DNA-binding response OmpR family regulator
VWRLLKSCTHEGSLTSLTTELQLLLVEGDSELAEKYKLKLELDGYCVTVVNNREAAVAALMESLPDLVFLDIRLQWPDGFEVLNHIRANKATRDLPVVVLSNESKDELFRRGLQLDAREWVIRSPTPLAFGPR